MSVDQLINEFSTFYAPESLLSSSQDDPYPSQMNPD
jgi:hypothetical protein